MITIISGDDINLSRKFFLEKKGNSTQPTLNGETVTLLDIKQIGTTGGLFEKSEPIFIEGLISNSRPSKRLDEIADYFKNTKDVDAYLWESKELAKKQTSAFGNPILETFKIPQNTFGFLDGIKPNSGKRNVELFHSALDASNEDLLFFMIIRQFRLLLAVSSNSQIDEAKRLAPWQKSKLLSQAKLYSQDSLLKIYEKLFQMDLDQKTGGLTMPLKESIDFFLLGL